MNNTHFAVVNEDNEPIAVLKKDGFKDRVARSIEDETGTEVVSLEFEESDYQNYKVTANLYDGNKYSVWLRPTWEY